jgi:membrane protease YdiL (CAAX protease family)
VQRRAFGIAAAILLIQMFFYVPSAINSTLLSSAWSTYQPDFLLYIILNLIALTILGLDKTNRDIREGNFTKFLLGFGVTAFAAWGLLTLVSLSFSVPSIDTNPSFLASRVPVVVYILGFVAPTEELMFREVLPRVFRKKGQSDFTVVGVGLSSVLLFPLFHVWTYSSSAGLGTALFAALMTAAVAGVVLAFIYHFAGYGAAVAAHGWYDLFVTGTIGGFAFTGLLLKPF